MSDEKRVVITGMGIVSSIGNNVKEVKEVVAENVVPLKKKRKTRKQKWINGCGLKAKKKLNGFG